MSQFWRENGLEQFNHWARDAQKPGLHPETRKHHRATAERCLHLYLANNPPTAYLELTVDLPEYNSVGRVIARSEYTGEDGNEEWWTVSVEGCPYAVMLRADQIVKRAVPRDN